MKIIDVNVNPTDYVCSVSRLLAWAIASESRYVCTANAHMLMVAHDSPQYKQIINSADLVTPDGMPLVWMLRMKGCPDQQRVYGPTLMLRILEAAARENISVGFYGSSPEVLQTLLIRMLSRFPDLKIDYSFSPPFREISEKEDLEIIKNINASSARVLFIGLGCPKQERWMAEHRGKIKAVMIGVGAAFDFHAGIKPQAPLWLQKIGLEWLFRLSTEPRRLWRRYFYYNPRFALLAALDLLGILR
jgi:N-acetylglucosaminyldiphosphoundecaprenol N-acetyl-beta-D-mannosaminyltransferase